MPTIITADSAPVLPSSKVEASALGISATMPEKIIKEKNRLTTLKFEDFTKEHISFLSKYFGSKVVTSLSSKGDGKIIISFKNEDDFNSILKKFK